MKYRVANPADWPEIVQFLNGYDYFMPIDPSTLGGHWLIAINEDKICGTLWFFAEPPHLYMDYWAATHPIIASKLAANLVTVCQLYRIQYVHGIIASDRPEVIRLVTEGFHGVAGEPYHKIFKEISLNGRNETNHNYNYTAKDSIRAVYPGPAPASNAVRRGTAG